MLKMVDHPKLSKPSKITTEIVTITPHLAESMLSKNTRNRKASRTSIDTYARDMKAGKWVMNGDAIRFDRNSNLLDGQHRLMACLKSGANFQSIVIYGLEPEVQDTIDGGRMRRTADVMAINGIGSAHLRTATCRILHAIKLDVPNVMAHKASTQEILTINAKHPLLSRSLCTQKSNIGVRPATLAAVHYIGKNLLGDDPATADAFAAVFASGVPAYKGCPALLVRERHIQGRLRGQPLSPTLGYGLIIHAWNHFRKHRAMKTMKVPADAKIEDLDIRKL
jgi:hypothetical protein